MPDVCLYFQVHQPHRLLTGGAPGRRDTKLNREILNRVADKCYLPANEMFRKRIEESHGLFRMAFSITGRSLSEPIKTATWGFIIFSPIRAISRSPLLVNGRSLSGNLINQTPT